jgi:hypothetical protein
MKTTFLNTLIALLFLQNSYGKSNKLLSYLETPENNVETTVLTKFVVEQMFIDPTKKTKKTTKKSTETESLTKEALAEKKVLEKKNAALESLISKEDAKINALKKAKFDQERQEFLDLMNNVKKLEKKQEVIVESTPTT